MCRAYNPQINSQITSLGLPCLALPCLTLAWLQLAWLGLAGVVLKYNTVKRQGKGRTYNACGVRPMTHTLTCVVRTMQCMVLNVY